MSSAKDDALAPGDGTQFSVASESFSDPLFGPVTSSSDRRQDDPEPIQAPDPIGPDPVAVRQMVDATVHGGQAGQQIPNQGSAAGRDSSRLTASLVVPRPEPGEPPLGMLSREREKPVRKVVRPKKKRDKSPRSRVKAADLIPRQKMSAGTAGFIVAAILMIAFAVVFVALLSNLFSSIGSMFN